MAIRNANLSTSTTGTTRARRAAATPHRQTTAPHPSVSNGAVAKKKRALTLAGGGPAVGIGLGVLKALGESPEIKFDVWSLSCVGAWLGCLYHVSPDRSDKYGYAEKKMYDFFRDDDAYDKFPCPTVFVPDIPEWIAASLRFTVDPRSYTNLVVPKEILNGYNQLLDFYLTPSKWNYGEFCHLLLNAFLAPNPAARFLMSMIWKNDLPGISKLWYPHYDLLQSLDMDLLAGADVPVLYHNAYNVDAQRLELFSNKDDKYQKITTETLCACSGLPYILSPVTINGTTYVEGATIDTVGFKDLLENHPDLDEVWVCRLLDTKEVHPHHNLVEALNNLVMLFAATTSTDDVKLFRFHLEKRNAEHNKKIALIEFPVDHHCGFEWTHSNLAASVLASHSSAKGRIHEYLRNGK
ncbi:MAG TPA: patatin-like phospholipase family protein [Stellaceae bacterium]|nr:patatin-like phospholipase family protein [Stellaceae bacterium]